MEILSLMLTALVVAGNISQVSGVRAYERRSDLLGVPDVGSIDWTVPLSNGEFIFPIQVPSCEIIHSRI